MSPLATAIPFVMLIVFAVCAIIMLMALNAAASADLEAIRRGDTKRPPARLPEAPPPPANDTTQPRLRPAPFVLFN